MDDGDVRPPTHRLALALIAVAGIAVALAWYAWLFVTFRAGVPIPVGGGEWVYLYSDAWAYDLDAYVSAAARLRDHGSLYDATLVAGPFQPGPRDLFYYAPPLGVAMLPIVDIPVHDSSVAWYALHVAAFALACALMPVRALIRVFAFVTMSLSSWALKDALAANVSLLLLLPYVMAWRWMDRPLGSIALAFAVSVRPSVGVLLLWQLLRRQWRALAWTVGTGLVLILVTLPFVGIDGYRDYFAVVGNVSPPTGPSENRDLGGVLIELGVTGSAVGMARVLSVVIAVAAILLSLRRDRETSFMVALSASLLLLPLLWNQYLLTLVLPMAFLAGRWRPIVLVLLPLLSWAPDELTPLILLGAIGALLLAPEAPQDDAEPAPLTARAPA